nr:uncharacterized protein LOC120962932 [Aegilops tauschii subsp. strangulata]
MAVCAPGVNCGLGRGAVSMVVQVEAAARAGLPSRLVWLGLPWPRLEVEGGCQTEEEVVGGGMDAWLWWLWMWRSCPWPTLVRVLEMVEAGVLRVATSPVVVVGPSEQLRKFGFCDLGLGEIPASRCRGLQRRRPWTPSPPWRRCFGPDPTPFLVLRGNPWSVLWTRQRRRHGVVPFLEASSCCSRSSGGTAHFGVSFYYGYGPPWRNVHHRGRCLDDAISRSAQALPSTYRLLLAQSVGICKVDIKRENTDNWNSGPAKTTSDLPILHIFK